MPSVKTMKAKKRELKADIRNIQAQLSSRPTSLPTEKEWKGRAVVSMNHKITELEKLTDDLTEARRLLTAERVSIWNKDDPREILLMLRSTVGDYLAGDWKSTRLNSSHIPLSRMPSSA